MAYQDYCCKTRQAQAIFFDLSLAPAHSRAFCLNELIDMVAFTQDDCRFMHMALELAAHVKGSTFPNPAVGAVIVRGKTVVGKGATAPCGGPHAEKRALAQAGPLAKNATLYVTLEPCSHFGRTPPCTGAIIESGVSRVVTALRDPFPRVRGNGLRTLRRHGIAVQTGLCREQAHLMNEEFFWAVANNRAWVTVKLAMTLDGRIADQRGGSKWITGKKSRQFVHDLRRRHAAIAVGSATITADDPKLNVRHVQGRSPARIVFSSDNKDLYGSYFWRHARENRSIIVRKCKKSGIVHDKRTGLEYWRIEGESTRQRLTAFLEMACTEGLTSILIEGGGALASSFLENRLANRLYFFYGNSILGGGVAGIAFGAPLTIGKPITLQSRDIQQFDKDLMVTGKPRWES